MGELEVQSHPRPHSEFKTSLVCFRPRLKTKQNKTKGLEPEQCAEEEPLKSGVAIFERPRQKLLLGKGKDSQT